MKTYWMYSIDKNYWYQVSEITAKIHAGRLDVLTGNSKTLKAKLLLHCDTVFRYGLTGMLKEYWPKGVTCRMAHAA